MASHHQEEHQWPNYLLVWFILLLLTGISIVASLLVVNFAPYLWRALLVFLFVLAGVKALLVVFNFMHLKFEAKYLWILCAIALCFVVFFLLGTVSDIAATQKQ